MSFVGTTTSSSVDRLAVWRIEGEPLDCQLDARAELLGLEHRDGLLWGEPLALLGEALPFASITLERREQVVGGEAVQRSVRGAVVDADGEIAQRSSRESRVVRGSVEVGGRADDVAADQLLTEAAPSGICAVV